MSERAPSGHAGVFQLLSTEPGGRAGVPGPERMGGAGRGELILQARRQITALSRHLPGLQPIWSWTSTQTHLQVMQMS